MKKAKPTKGSARVKKFDQGGTIGALAGLGTLAYLLSRKKDEGKVGAGETIKPLKEAAEEAEPAEYKAQGKFPDEAGYGTSQGGPAERETAAPTKKTPMKGSIGKGATSKAKASPVDAMLDKASQSFPLKTRADEKVGAGYEGLTTLPKYTANENRPSKPYPKDVKGTERDPYLRGMGPKNTFLTEKRLEDAKKAMRGGFSNPFSGISKAIEEGNASSARDREQRKERIAAGMKKGGAVKKYAKGGTVTSASNRSYGIAQRCKTRGKVL